MMRGCRFQWAVIAVILAIGPAFADSSGNSVNTDGPSATDIANRTSIPIEEQRLIDERVLESFLRAYQDQTQLEVLSNELSDKVARERAMRIQPNQQRHREVPIDTTKSRGPFPVWVYPSQLTVVAFLDSFGEPWPLTSKPVNPNTSAYQIQWAESAPHIIQLSVLQPYSTTSIGVMLEGHTLPITFSLKNGEGIQDVTVSYRVNGVAPGNRSSMVAVDPPLQTPILSEFSREDIPSSARVLSLTGKTESRAWEYDGIFILSTKGTLVYPTKPFAVESAPDSDVVFYAFKQTPDAVAIQFGSRPPLTLGIR